MNSRDRSDLLVSWALEEGFDRAATATLEPLEHGEALDRWLERGDHAGMEWLARRREVRREPARILPGARSVLCLAVQYWPPDGPEEGVRSGDLWAGVARYALGDDYHELLLARLKRLAARIEEAFPGTGQRYYVDTGPVLERELAARAGLGAVGKNTLLLHPEAGSWFFLAEIFLTLELAPGEPLADLCGSCTRCLEACPTGALPEPYRLDSRRCISYWTIEHRGSLPREVRPLLGEWVFGCDVCQEVCPVNVDPAPPTSRAELALPERRRKLDLAGLLSLDRSAYVGRFRRSPMKRAKLSGLKRNAAVAMGNSGRRRYVEPLATALAGDPDETVRGAAAWALGRIGGERAVDSLRRSLAAETDPEVVDELRKALADCAGASSPGAV